MSNETLTDRLDGPSSYVLDGIGVVQVIPPGGVRWDPPGDYSFERDRSDQGALTAAAFRSRYQGSAVALLPPTDVRAGAFTSCVSCASVPAFRRCSDCPRGRARLNVRRAVPASEPRPRRWWRWRKQRESYA